MLRCCWVLDELRGGRRHSTLTCALHVSSWTFPDMPVPMLMLHKEHKKNEASDHQN